MRDSINYNLKYFIMKMSGTKPMKNTMRKPSPLKIDGTIAAYLAEKRGEKPTTYSPEQNEANKAKRDAHKASFRAAHKAKLATKGATTSGTFTTKKKDTTETSVKSKTPTPKPTSATKPVEGKPNASVKPTGKKAIDTVKKVAATATKGAVKSALMQLKKHKR